MQSAYLTQAHARYARMQRTRTASIFQFSNMKIAQLTDAEWQHFLAFVSCEIQFMARRHGETGARNQMDFILLPFIFCNLIIEIFFPVPRRKIVIGQKWIGLFIFVSLLDVPLAQHVHANTNGESCYHINFDFRLPSCSAFSLLRHWIAKRSLWVDILCC